MLHREKGVIANDDADFEDQIAEEPKKKDQGDSKEDPPLEELQRKERKINMKTSLKLGSSNEINPLIKSWRSNPRCEN